jgi:hypothetical protein
MTTPLAFKDAREWGELVARVFSGDAPTEIVPPGIILASDLPEWAVLRKVIPWQVGNTAGAGGVGNFSMVQITAGPPVDAVAVVERLYVVCASGFLIDLISPPNATTSSLRVKSRDLRAQSLVSFAGANSALLAAVGSLTQFPATPVQGEEIPIKPFVVGTLASGAQTALSVCANLANTAISVFAWGYQRRLRPEERQLD